MAWNLGRKFFRIKSLIRPEERTVNCCNDFNLWAKGKALEEHNQRISDYDPEGLVFPADLRQQAAPNLELRSFYKQLACFKRIRRFIPLPKEMTIRTVAVLKRKTQSIIYLFIYMNLEKSNFINASPKKTKKTALLLVVFLHSCILEYK